MNVIEVQLSLTNPTGAGPRLYRITQNIKMVFSVLDWDDHIFYMALTTKDNKKTDQEVDKNVIYTGQAYDTLDN